MVDMTLCFESLTGNCDMDCERNKAKYKPLVYYQSFANMKGTERCPKYQAEQALSERQEEQDK